MQNASIDNIDFLIENFWYFLNSFDHAFLIERNVWKAHKNGLLPEISVNIKKGDPLINFIPQWIFKNNTNDIVPFFISESQLGENLVYENSKIKKLGYLMFHDSVLLIRFINVKFSQKSWRGFNFKIDFPEYSEKLKKEKKQMREEYNIKTTNFSRQTFLGRLLLVTGRYSEIEISNMFKDIQKEIYKKNPITIFKMFNILK